LNKTSSNPRRCEAAAAEMEVVALVSGGKDSCFAMMRCLDYGHKIVALANLIPEDDAVDELDSYMYQTVGHQIVVSYAKCMGLPLFRRRIRGSSREQGLKYNVTTGDEVEDMFALLSEVKRQIPSITAVSSGAIASDYQRLRVESVCSRLGLVSLAYLWKQDQTLLLDEMIRRGIVAIIVKVAAMGLKPSAHLGKELAELKCHLLQLNEYVPHCLHRSHLAIFLLEVSCIRRPCILL
jgi:diphthine-ammonia ligase